MWSKSTAQNNNASPISLAYFVGTIVFNWCGMQKSTSFLLSTMGQQQKIPGVIKFYGRTGSIHPNQQWNADGIKHQLGTFRSKLFSIGNILCRCVCVCTRGCLYPVYVATLLCVHFIPSGNRQCDSNSSIFKSTAKLFYYFISGNVRTSSRDFLRATPSGKVEVGGIIIFNENIYASDAWAAVCESVQVPHNPMSMNSERRWIQRTKKKKGTRHSLGSRTSKT